MYGNITIHNQIILQEPLTRTYNHRYNRYYFEGDKRNEKADNHLQILKFRSPEGPAIKSVDSQEVRGNSIGKRFHYEFYHMRSCINVIP